MFFDKEADVEPWQKVGEYFHRKESASSNEERCSDDAQGRFDKSALAENCSPEKIPRLSDEEEEEEVVEIAIPL